MRKSYYILLFQIQQLKTSIMGTRRRFDGYLIEQSSSVQDVSTANNLLKRAVFPNMPGGRRFMHFLNLFREETPELQFRRHCLDSRVCWGFT